MKKNYSKPVIEDEIIQIEDVIALSNRGLLNYDPYNDPDSEEFVEES